MTDLQTAIDRAYTAAESTFEPRREFPLGWVYAHRLDGRTKLARALSDDNRFLYHASNGSNLGPQGSYIKFAELNCQSIDPKAEAMRAFLSELQDEGYGDDLRVFTRWD